MFRHVDGTVVEGVWEFDRKHGTAIIKKPNGKIQNGEFQWDLFFNLQKGSCTDDKIVWFIVLACIQWLSILAGIFLGSVFFGIFAVCGCV
jgi:hypothetical protein